MGTIYVSPDEVRIFVRVVEARSFSAADLASGRLRRVLEGHEPAETDVHVVYPGGRFLPARVRAFIDLVLARLTPPPWAARS